MNRILSKFVKAALIGAAFLFCNSSLAITSIENIKNKAAELLAQKQKDKAIQLIINYSKTERSRAYKNETSELLFGVGQSFLTKEAQEEYENSLNNTLENEKLAFKSVERCLKLEVQNLDCLIQKARLYHLSKSVKNFISTIEEIKSLLMFSAYEPLFQLFIDQSTPEFKNKQILSQLPAQPNERTIMFLIFEIDRSIDAKNYSRVREIINYAEKFYSDWPDATYYKYRLNNESAESLQKHDDDLLVIYLNKCKSISKSNSRKFRYDFDFCSRGKNI